MPDAFSFDIHVLGLVDASPSGRTRFASTMERLTGRPGSEFEQTFPKAEDAAFQYLDQEKARLVAGALGDSGVLIEVRPRVSAPGETEAEQSLSVRVCPSCQHTQPMAAEECEACGVVFAKFEREQVFKMQKDRCLEEALTKALQVREEWLNRAKQYLETHPIPEDATEGFGRVLMRDELPFLRLASDEGPILMTSRRMIAAVGEIFHSIPYEMISDVDVGGGLVVKKNKVRLHFAFHSQIPLGGGEMKKSLTWQLDKDSSFYKEVIMDWAFARSFICGGCGERDLQYRTDGNKVRARCMHCATDHEIDAREAVAVPLIKEE